MTDLARRSLARARAALGVTEHPPGSNRGPEVDGYLRDVGLDASKGAYPWCAAFVSAMVMRTADDHNLPHQFHGSASVRKLLELNKMLEIPGPEPGCIFIHLGEDGHGHAGFVESLAAGGALETIEGNSDAHGSRTGGSVVTGFRRAGYAQHFLVIC